MLRKLVVVGIIFRIDTSVAEDSNSLVRQAVELGKSTSAAMASVKLASQE
jgi:hypothetical protein